MPNAVLIPTTKDPSTSKIILTGKHFLGRALHNTTVIKDVNISRSHCHIEQKEGEWFLTDTSSNGTTINGNIVRNDTHKLEDHDIIMLSSGIAYEYLVCAETNEKENETPVTVLDKLLLETNPPNETQSTSEMASKLDDKTVADIVEDEFQCSICTELFIKAVTLSCSHTFCNYCISLWRKNQTACPICRSEIKNLFPTIVLDSYIEKIIQNRSEEYKRHRKAIIDERDAQASAAPGPSTSNTRKRRRPAADPIEISSGDDTDETTDDEYNDGEDDDDDSFYDDDGDYYGDLFYNGLPGHYYGGYGSCYRCGRRGHWANGCPFKRVC